MADILLFNSLTRKKERFTPINPDSIGLYTCGMTVYDYAHIGHGRKYVNDDLLRRVLAYNGYKVKHVQNITDVGHLVSDADEGEDKLEKGAKKQGKTVWEVAEFFTKHFFETFAGLNVLTPDVVCKATEHIAIQIEMIGKLFAKGFAYDTPEAVYFDVGKFPGYGNIFGQALNEKKVAAREGVETGENKRNPQDFALWFKRVGRFSDHVMHWDSPWGDGFPGWHIECSAMSTHYLGDQFDIHTGGIEHMAVHHPNEIAQSEGATGKSPFVHFWVHHGHLMIDGAKMSKSLGNYYTIEDVANKGFDPLALRYFYFTAHYKKPLNFTWEGLTAAQTALFKLRELATEFRKNNRGSISTEKEGKLEEYRSRFIENINDDLNVAGALAVVWEMVKSNIPSPDKYDLLLTFDEVLGFGLRALPDTSKDTEIPAKIIDLLGQRNEARGRGDFKKADELRAEIEKEGYTILDGGGESKVKKG